MSRAQAIRGAVEVSSKILDCADVGTCGMLSVITALEFFQHYFAKMGHRNTSCDPHLHQVIEQPMLPTSREASAARAATSKRACVDLIWWGILLDGWQPGNKCWYCPVRMRESRIVFC